MSVLCHDALFLDQGNAQLININGKYVLQHKTDDACWCFQCITAHYVPICVPCFGSARLHTTLYVYVKGHAAFHSHPQDHPYTASHTLKNYFT